MTRPVALRILVLAAAIGLAAQALLLDNLLGINAPILAGALLGAAFVLRPAERRIDPLDRWLPPAAFAISVAIAIRADPTSARPRPRGRLRPAGCLGRGDRGRGRDEAVRRPGRRAGIPGARLGRNRDPARRRPPRVDRTSVRIQGPAGAVCPHGWGRSRAAS